MCKRSKAFSLPKFTRSSCGDQQTFQAGDEVAVPPEVVSKQHLLSRRRGFTLIELLVVIAIIAILVALLLPAVQSVREAARRSQCQDHLHNLVIAFHNYEGAYKIFPPGLMRTIGTPNPNDGTTGQGNGIAWSGMLLPYIEQKPLYDSINFSGFGDNFIGEAPSGPTGASGQNLFNDDGPRERAVSTLIEIYRCPSSGDPLQVSRNDIPTRVPGNYGGVHSGAIGNPCATTANGYPENRNGDKAWNFDDSMFINDFSGNGGSHARMHGMLVSRFAVKMSMCTDGTSNTAVLGEWLNKWVHPATGNIFMAEHEYIGTGFINDKHHYHLGTLGAPINYASKRNGVGGPVEDWDIRGAFSSNHPGGAQFGLADGKVTFLSENSDDRVRYALGSRDGGEAVSLP